MATYNEGSFNNKFNSWINNSKTIRDKMYAKATTNFEENKKEMLQEYEETDVVQELRYGGFSNNSKLISEGNLFAFLGFDKNENPASELKNYLKTNITMAKTPVITKKGNNVINFGFRVNIPSERTIYSNFPTPWSSKSWIDYIENGLGNASRFIFWSMGFGSPPSRSGTGLQLKRGDRKNPPSFTPMQFLSTVLDNFINRFK